MKGFVKLLLGSCLAIALTSSSCRKPLDGKRFIVCANSMVYYGGCVHKGDAGFPDDGLFYKLLEANGVRDVTVIDNTYGGHRLKDYLEDGCQMENGGGSGCPGQGVDLLSGLDLGSFDYVILSEAGNNFEDFFSYAESLYRRFTSVNPQAKLVYINHVYSVYKNHHHVLDGLRRLHDELGVTIVNCGQLAYDIYTGKVQVPGGSISYSDRYTFCNHTAKDTYHPNPLMGYIMAQMLYCALSGDSAEGFDYSALVKGCFFGDGTVSYDDYFDRFYPDGAALPFTEVLDNENEMRGIQKLIPEYVNKF